ncbi:cysteine-rich CWC family protein [Marinomonas gallaica]|uniref:cysteine-rich CWC family protein n=1 Tax=Marinomonas gallaica TaxID=1806667 RepID=UPI001B8C79EB
MSHHLLNAGLYCTGYYLTKKCGKLSYRLSVTELSCCPLCRAQNQCAITLGHSAESCWCHDPNVLIPANLLAKVPDVLKGKACICQKCVEEESTKTGRVQQISPKRW